MLLESCEILMEFWVEILALQPRGWSLALGTKLSNDMIVSQNSGAFSFARVYKLHDRMLPRLLRTRALLGVGGMSGRRSLIARRTLISAPKAGDGPLMERRPDRELPGTDCHGPFLPQAAGIDQLNRYPTRRYALDA